MRSNLRRPLRLQPTPLAACLSTLFALNAAPALAGVSHVVVTCDDSPTAISTPGTLRYWVKNAATGDTIDLGDIVNDCSPSTITLQQGELEVTQDDLNFFGPSNGTVTITANHGSRVIKHSGTGILTISSLTIADGKYAGENAAGGCIYSKGRVDLIFSTVTGCLAKQTNGADTTAKARGGGIFAAANVDLYDYSSVSRNRADASYDPASAGAFGGGVYSGGQIVVRRSTIDGNEAVGNAGAGSSQGGGAFVAGGRVGVYWSTVSNNRGDMTGGIYQKGQIFVNTISDSTISGNYAANGVGGVDLGATTSVANSTIVFNTGNVGASGLRVRSTFAELDITSTIVASNPGPQGTYDVDFDGKTLSGSDNLISSMNVVAPAGLITVTGDPLLGPLANHGGPTRTHALLPGSPAIAMGDDLAGLLYDQRGNGYLRTVTLIKVSWTDIGAYQVQLFDDDQIFFDAFGKLPGG